MNAQKLKWLGYYCTLINNGDIKVEHYTVGGHGFSDWITIIPYQPDLSLDERMALGWELATAHWVARRLDDKC